MRFELFVGLNRGTSFDHAPSPASFATPEAIGIVARELRAVGIDGATIAPSVGIWKGAQEASLVMTIFSDLPEDVGVLGFRLLSALRQDCILVACGERSTLLVTGSTLDGCAYEVSDLANPRPAGQTVAEARRAAETPAERTFNWSGGGSSILPVPANVGFRR